MAGAGNRRPGYFAPPEWAVPRNFIATIGLPIRDDGTNEAEDLTLASRNALIARHLGLRELVDHHLDLGGAPGNTGDKMLTLVASALAGGDCIDDANALRAGGSTLSAALPSI